MDKFDQTMIQMNQMDMNEKMMKMQMYMSMCGCPECSSYMECSKMDKDGMFCLTGPSMICATSKMSVNMCNCTSCKLEKELKMGDKMYCMKGSEFEARYMKKMM